MSARYILAPNACAARCLRSQPLLNPRSCRIELSTVLICMPSSRRCASQQSFPSSAGQQGRKRNASEPRTQVTFGQFLRAMFRSNMRVFSNFRAQGLRQLFRQSPEETVVALVSLAACAAILVYIVWVYFTYFQAEQFTRFPKPIAKTLRKALYYSNIDPNMEKALKYYKVALEQCQELGLDPFSDEVMGIKIQIAAWLEHIGSFDSSINVLEALLDDCVRFVDMADKSGISDGKGHKVSADAARDQSGTIDAQEVAKVGSETLWGKRNRILAKSIGISSKLGELYSDEHVLQTDKAHERLIWAVETALGEARRRSVEGVKDGEGQWLDNNAIGASLEGYSLISTFRQALGHSYESRSQFELAGPLFLQALRLCQDPCHSAVLMNNLASSIAQQPSHTSYQTTLGAVDAPMASSATTASGRVDRDTNLDAARRWAENALQHARETQGQQRTADCDQSCAVALCNLGDFALMSGDTEEARRRFKECIDFSKSIGFTKAVQQAEDGLQRLRKQSGR